MVFIKKQSTQVGLVMNLVNGSMLLQFHVVFNYIYHNVVSSTYIYPYVWKRLVISRNSSIQVIWDQEDDPELNENWLTTNDQFNVFRRSRYSILWNVKGAESPSVQGPQYYEEYLFVRYNFTSKTERQSVSEPGTNVNHASISQIRNDYYSTIQ